MEIDGGIKLLDTKQ